MRNNVKSKKVKQREKDNQNEIKKRESLLKKRNCVKSNNDEITGFVTQLCQGNTSSKRLTRYIILPNQITKLVDSPGACPGKLDLNLTGEYK